MIDHKEIIQKSVELMQSGCSIEDNISQSTTNKSEVDLYIHACIYYNYGLYEKCLDRLLYLYNIFNKIDQNLFMYSFYQMLTSSANIDKLFFCQICKIHSEVKDLYSGEQIEMLNKCLFYYLDAVKNAPDCIVTFLGNIISPDIVKRIISKSDPQDNLLNSFISTQIDFDKIKGKTVYNCYYNESSSGIGDFLRGCCYLFDLLDSTETNYGISFAKHDISPYLKSRSKPKFKKEDILDTEKINKELCIGANYIENIKKNIVNVLQKTTGENIFLFTNYSDFIDNPSKADRISITKNCQEFMQNNLMFSKSIERESGDILSNVSEDYVVMHFRLGDRKIISSNCLDDSNINTKQYKIKLPEMKRIILDKHKETGKEIIVMSDSNELKQYVQKTMSKKYRGKIHIIHSNSQHCSNNPGFIVDMKIDKKKKKDNMFYVALDMKLITKSSHIYSYSVYPWGSGFVFWLAKIFNIPISTNLIGQ